MYINHTIKKVLFAFIISLIPSYLLIAFLTYSKFKKRDESYILDLDFLVNVIGYMWSDIQTLRFLFLVPLALPIPLIYLFVFYKVAINKNKTFMKYKMCIMILLFIALHLFAHKFYIAM